MHFFSRALACMLGLGLGMVVGVACGGGSASDCTVGSQMCACTAGGGCDPGLVCIDEVCISVSNSTSGETGDTPSTMTASNTSASTTSATSTSSATSGTDSASTGGIKLDVGASDDVPTGPCAETGCKKVDMVFAIDSSLSMIEEINALSATQSFQQIVQTLSALNCGGIEYRVGLTNDNDGGWIGFNGMPWFDSNEMTEAEIATAFNAAAGTVLGNGGTAIGCEHVLSSSADLLASDGTGFVRDDALLVMVLVTDVDDYGYYDQQGFGGPCDSFLCTASGDAVTTIYDNLVGLKGGDASGLAAIVVAGDPNVTAGMNTCQQPASCCGGGIECAQAHHAPRLYEFASLQTAQNGVTVDICAGAQQLPAAVQQALEEDIDLACQQFEPEG